MNKKIISALVVLAVVLGGFGGAAYSHKKQVQAEPQQSVTQEVQDAAEAEAPAETKEDAEDPEDSSNSEGCVSDDAENFY